MTVPKLGKTDNGEDLHYSAGAFIQNSEGKYLLIDRKNIPYGFAGPAGHVDEGEDAFTALHREVLEETGLKVVAEELLYEGEPKELANRECSRGVSHHFWNLYRVKVEGELVWNQEETKSIGWYTVDEIKELNLEPIWEYWFKKLGIL